MRALPQSSVPLSTGLLGVSGLLAAFVVVLAFKLPLLQGVLLFLVGCGMPMYYWECRRSAFTPRYCKSSPARRALRLIGLLAIAGSFMFELHLFQVFAPASISGFYELQPLLLPFAVLWGVWMCCRAVPAWRKDSVEAFGCVIHRFIRRRALRVEDRNAVLSWMVKIFFLPLMLAGCVSFLTECLPVYSWPQDFLGWYALFWGLCYVVDTAFATIGYCCTSRRVNAHIRSVDQTWLGWIVALICYSPFFLWFSLVFFYKDEFVWSTWLRESWWLPWWGGLILLLTFIYMLATVAFGLRFSNLTYRGLITTGPYRYSKHPAYICKNISWWLIAVPFIPAFGWQVALAQCASLLVINFIYFLRAKTEERHLMRYPEYRQYAEYIAEYGLFARLRAFCRFKKNTAETA